MGSEMCIRDRYYYALRAVAMLIVIPFHESAHALISWKLGDSTAKDIMIPRIDVTFVSVDASYDEVLDIFREAGYSRLPVYEGSKDHVVGIVYFKDVYFYRSQHRGEIFHLKDVLRKPFFTYETQKVSSLLAQMREKSVSFSIVLDEYGVTAGLITLEDIVEEIFGELRDEYDDSEEETFKKLSDGSLSLIHI